MHWQVRELLTMKREFVMLAQQDGTNITELCRRFGISRECGYKWLRAYQEAGELGLREKSRRPGSHPLQTGREMEKVVLELRAQYPAWGGRKLKRRLEQLRCGHSLEKFPRILMQARDILERFMDAFSCIDQCFIADSMLEELPTPSSVGKTKVGGIDLNKARMRWVVEALIVLCVSPSPRDLRLRR
jgi:transposase-like protein